jgi:diguanylate cyclase (GGDEF)-like protein
VGTRSGLLLAALSTTELVVAGLVLLVLVCGLFVAVRAFRASGRDADERMTLLVAELDRRTNEIRDELVAALERERVENRRARSLGELASSIDLEEVLRRTLESAAALAGVDAAHVAVVTPGGDTVTRSTGLSDSEAEDVQLGPVPTGKRVRSFVVAYGGPDGGDAAIDSALALPLRGGEDVVGLLAVFTRVGAGELPGETSEAVEDLAASAGPAVENARRYHEARRLADIDSHTGLHNRRYFHETLAREVARSERYDRPLTVIVFDVDDFKTVNDRFGHLTGDTVLGEVGERVRGVVRTSDIACRVGGDEFGVILPESTLEDAEQLFERLKSHMASNPIPQAGRLQISAGIAGLRPQDNEVSLFERADDALYRAKEAGKGRVAIATTAIGRATNEVTPSAISRIEREEG